MSDSLEIPVITIVVKADAAPERVLAAVDIVRDRVMAALADTGMSVVDVFVGPDFKVRESFRRSLVQSIRAEYEKAMNSDSPSRWEWAYGAVFELYGSLRRWGITIDWCDPDMGYDDDTIAFVHAVRDQCPKYWQTEELEVSNG